MEDFQSIKKKFNKLNAWGLSCSFDLKSCNPEFIREADKIKQFVIELCDLIEMKRFGDCQVVHFGEDEKVAGYSMIQLIETSLISSHMRNEDNSIYLDVFSCKLYDPEKVANFAINFFEAVSCKVGINYRV